MSLLSDIGTAIKNKLGGTSVDNTVPRYDGTTCKLQGSGVTISDTNAVTASGGFVGNLSGGFVSATTGTFSGDLKTAGTIGIGTGGTLGAGTLYSDPNWGMILRAKQANPNITCFSFQNSIGTELARINSDGSLAPSGPIIGTTTTALGYNQSWQDVTASRASGVTYTNSTGKPIFVLLTFYNDISVYLDAIPAFMANNEGLANATSNISIVIPNGSTYKFTSQYGIIKWLELR